MSYTGSAAKITSVKFPSIAEIIAQTVKKTVTNTPGSNITAEVKPVENKTENEVKTSDLLKANTGDTLKDYSLLLKETSDSAANDKYSQTVSELEKYLKSEKERAQSGYISNIENLEKDKLSNERAAAVEYEKLLKYLPQYLKSTGLSSLGVSQSSLISAKDSYSDTLGDITDRYNESKTSYENEKQSAISSAIKDYYSKLLSAQKENTDTLNNNSVNYYDSEGKRNSEISALAYEKAASVLSGNDYKYGTGEKRVEYLLSLKPYMLESDWKKILLAAADLD